MSYPYLAWRDSEAHISQNRHVFARRIDERYALELNLAFDLGAFSFAAVGVEEG